MNTQPTHSQFGTTHEAAERQVRRIIHSRALRAEFFDSTLFADPAWDILLALYLSKLTQRRISVSQCCRSAKVPQTTALRYIAELCDRSLVLRETDHFDGRRVFLSLSTGASDAMAKFMTAQRQFNS